MFTRIAHVCLTVTDLQRSIDWYEKLDLTPLFRFTRNGLVFGVYMRLADGTYVEMFEDPGRGSVVNNGIAHFCLETDDIDRVTAMLAERGVPFTPKKLGCDNTWQIWLEDPDGNRFEVHQYTPASTQFAPAGGLLEADW